MAFLQSSRNDFFANFQRLCAKTLSSAERNCLYHSLKTYHRKHDVAAFVRETHFLWASPKKLRLLPFVRRVLAVQDRPQFDDLLGVHEGLVIERFRSHPLDKSPSLSSSRSGNHPMGRQGGIHVIKIRTGSNPHMGFCVRGGSEFGLGIYVSQVEPESPAEAGGLRSGDQILEANGIDFDNLTSTQAVELLGTTHAHTLIVRRTRKIPEWKVTKERILWYDVAKRRLVEIPSAESVPSRKPGTLSREVEVIERKIVLRLKKDSDFIGLNIRGGKEYGLGIYVSRVDKGGLAERTGIQVGDQLVQANKHPLFRVSHSKAAEILRSSRKLVLTLWAVGRFPAYKELFCEYVWSDSTVRPVLPASHMTGPQNKGRYSGGGRLTQRARTHEIRVDQSLHDSGIVENGTEGFNADTDDDFPLQPEIFYPRDKDIIFRGSYSKNWRQLDRIYGDGSISSNGSARLTNSVSLPALNNHLYPSESDSSDLEMDYTTFLEKKMKKDAEKTATSSVKGSQRDLTHLDRALSDTHLDMIDDYAEISHVLYGEDPDTSRDLYRENSDIYAVVNKPRSARKAQDTGSLNNVLEGNTSSPNGSSTESSESSTLRASGSSTGNLHSKNGHHHTYVYHINSPTANYGRRDVFMSKDATPNPVASSGPLRTTVSNYTTSHHNTSDDEYTVVTEVLEEDSTSFRAASPSVHYRLNAKDEKNNLEDISSSSSSDVGSMKIKGRGAPIKKPRRKTSNLSSDKPPAAAATSNSAGPSLDKTITTTAVGISAGPSSDKIITTTAIGISSEPSSDKTITTTAVGISAAPSSDKIITTTAVGISAGPSPDKTTAVAAIRSNAQTGLDKDIQSNVSKSTSSLSIQSANFPEESVRLSDGTNAKADSSHRTKAGDTGNTLEKPEQPTTLELLAEEINRLEVRKSNLGSREIVRLKEDQNVGTPKKEKKEDDKKGGTWSAFKKKLTGSTKSKKEKKRDPIPVPEAFALETIGKKKIVPEHNGVPNVIGPYSKDKRTTIGAHSADKSMAIGPHTIDKYNMMMVEERTRQLLSNDERDAVLRHIKNYHDTLQLERLIELLVAILDKQEKLQLLKDIRGIIYPHQLPQFDSLVARHEVTAYEKMSTKLHLPLSPVYRSESNKKPRPKIMTAVLDENGHFHIQHFEEPKPHWQEAPRDVTTVTHFSKKGPTTSVTTVNNLSNTHPILEPPLEWRDDIKVILVENEPAPPPPPPPPPEEGFAVYVSKQKKNLGLIVCGGVGDFRDPSVRIEMVMPWGAAADDDRIQAGMHILSVDGQSVEGMTQSEAIAVLKRCFNDTRNVNMKLMLKNP